MEDHENIFDKLKELLGSFPNQMRILEDKIDIDLQLEYFELSKRLTKKEGAEFLAMSESLFNENVSFEVKKNILTRKLIVKEINLIN